MIELATPPLVRGLNPPPSRVILACGEEPDKLWLEGFRHSVRPVPVLIRREKALSYVSEQGAPKRILTGKVRRFLERLFAGPEPGKAVIWAHNQGLGRNILLTIELERACVARGLPLIFHHHDWWFDNRWARWPEMRRVGVRTVAAAGKAILSVRDGLKHVAINLADAAILKKHLGVRASWLPNPADARTTASKTAVVGTRRWLHDTIGESCPVWLMPCRLLRRKNIAEALLLTRWLRPEACLITTGGVTSPDEHAYYDRLEKCARDNHWRVRLALLEKGDGRSSGGPSIHELLAASEAVLLTSLQEGFGLAYLEAAAAQRPLIARKLDNIMPDLAKFGLRFPQSYDQILVHPSLFDWDAEVRRQKRLFSAWRRQIPRACRRLADKPWLMTTAKASPAPFNRLTLTAQMEVLGARLETSWNLCAPLNPFLAKWRCSARDAGLEVTAWPGKADRWLSGPAYARQFQTILEALPPRSGETPPAPQASVGAQEELMRQKLAAENLYPLLWSPQT